ncbi:aspartic proteinase PCS1 isoform X2 [Punica granatum]|nr:aspartic proteinase PCS1 isoform X2 [Punica granatum]
MARVGAAEAASRLPFRHNVTLTVTLAAGTPLQPVTMVLDTGSELSWLHCKKSPGLRSVFDPAASRSYSPVPCSSQTCRTRTRDLPVPASCGPEKLCHTIVSYADASSIEGNLSSETFQIGTTARPGFLFGCMDSGQSSNPEEDSKTTGLLGMNRGSLSVVTQMGLEKFSYCISGSDATGILLFGDANFTWVGPLNYTPMIQISTPLPYFDRVAYTVQMEGIRVSGKILALPKSVFVPDHTGAGQTMVDSGTQFTFLLGPVYNALRNEFAEQTKGLLKLYDNPNYVFQGAMDLCFLVPLGRARLPALPHVALMFRGAEMVVSGERLLYRVPGLVKGNDQVHCFTFGNSDLLGVEAFVIGNHHQQDKWVEFDLANSRVGLADVRCDLASQRLGLDS